MTAVEWLFTTLDNILELYPSEWEKVSKAVEQAKAMEKQQMIDFTYKALTEAHFDSHRQCNVEKLYNETYNK
jgi:hypothetical protein